DSQIRTVLVRDPAAPKKARPSEPNTVVPKGPRQPLPHNSGLIQVPKGRSDPPTSTAASGPKEGAESPALVETSSVGSPKRKAEERIEEPRAKKPATAKAKTSSWLYTGRLEPTTTHRSFFPVKPKGTTAKSSHSKRASKNNAGPLSKVVDPDTSKAVNNSNGGSEKVSAAEKQTTSGGVTPPGLENLSNCCFANSMLQALYAIKEFRDHFISKIRHCTDTPDTTGDQSLGLGLGRLFRRMQEAVRDGAKVSAEEFLRAFGSRHQQYDGLRQQEAYDFLEKLFTELKAEEANFGGQDVPDVSLVKDLFAGQTATRV
ncbi:MAG: hypothetical protein Q9196_004561, partial [Gyalolechia fulgens]